VRVERAREREDGPIARGRVRAQAADDEPHVADRAARRDALAARIPALLRADDALPPRAALLPPDPARDRARGQRRARRRGRGRAVHRRARAPARAARRGAARGEGAHATIVDRALLRADDRVARGWPVGLAAAWNRRVVGRGRGNEVMVLREAVRRVLDVVVSALALAVCAPLLLLAIVAIRLSS